MKAKVLALCLLLVTTVAQADPWTVISGKVPQGRIDSTEIDLEFCKMDISPPKGWRGPANDPYPNTKIVFNDGYGTFQSTIIDRVYFVSDENGTRLYLTVEGVYEGRSAICYIGLCQYTHPISYNVYLFVR